MVFTLVEMIVVMLIVIVLVGLVVPAMKGILESNNLTTAGQILNDQIRLARQTASARNFPVEIRLIQSSESGGGYKAVQLWSKKLSSTPGGAQSAALSKAGVFPVAITIAGNAGLSGLLGVAGVTNPSFVMPAGGSYANAKYAAFQIMPAGLIKPSADMKTLFLTVVPVRYAGGTALPANYIIVQVNPDSGNPVIFQP